MQRKISLVLSGGGARGIAHIGVIEALEKRGFEIASISGTSMGALVGGVYAAGKLKAFKKWICSLDKLKVFHLVDFSFSTQGLIKGDRVFGKIDEFVGDTKIEDLGIPYVAVAVDILNKKEVIFDSGSLYDAIRASVAIPTVITPVKANNTILVDGGILNNLPVDRIKRVDDDLLVAVNVNANIPPIVRENEGEKDEKSEHSYLKNIKKFQEHLQKISPFDQDDKLGFFDLMNRSIMLMTYQITQLSLERHAPDLLIQISRESCGAYDFYRAKEMVEVGYLAAESQIDAYLEKQTEIG
jgi:NTE family protein